MNAPMPIQAKPPFNRDMFRWARERRDLTVGEAAAGVGVKPEVMVAWERGEAVPTVRQARKLADLYQRSFLEFFRAAPPGIVDSPVVPDFRLHRGESRPHERRDLKDLQAWAESVRANALDLLEILGERATALPTTLAASQSTPPATAAARARDGLDFPLAAQMDRKAAERDGLPKRLRGALEAAGILVLKAGALASLGARGLCIAADPLPVILFAGEAPTAQLFTLAHELGHVCLGASAVSGPPTADDSRGPDHGVETWCNRFAAAFLIPEATLVSVWERPARPAPRIEDDQLTRLAHSFAVSTHAMLLRLIELRYVAAAHYWEERRARFLEEEAAYKSGGRSIYYGSRYRAAVGDFYTGMVLEAWNTGRITNHNAAEFMGIKTIRHLEDIRDHFPSE